MLRPAPTYLKRSERDGSGRQAECHQQCSGRRRSRILEDIFRLPNARRLRFCGRKAALYRRWRVGSDGRRQRSLGSCGATPILAHGKTTLRLLALNHVVSDSKIPKESDNRRVGITLPHPGAPDILGRRAWPSNLGRSQAMMGRTRYIQGKCLASSQRMKLPECCSCWLLAI